MPNLLPQSTRAVVGVVALVGALALLAAACGPDRRRGGDDDDENNAGNNQAANAGTNNAANGGTNSGTIPDPCPEEGMELCGDFCTSVQIDPRNCGRCGMACGADERCEGGACRFDCRQGGCVGFTWCDVETGSCEPGCASTEACGAASTCDMETRACVCWAAHHACGVDCLPDDAVGSCGERCEPCPDDPRGVEGCVQGQCTLTCEQGTLDCGGRCAECDLQGRGWSCEGERCVAAACGVGYRLCEGRCCPLELEVIENVGRVGTLRLDGAGRPVFVYVSVAGARGVVAWGTEEGWYRSTATTEEVWFTQTPSLGLDAAGRVYTAAGIFGEAELATQAEPGPTDLWAHEAITASRISADWLRIAVEPSGQVHAAWIDNGEGLSWAVRAPLGGWSEPVVVDAAGVEGEGAGLALDDAGRPHVCYAATGGVVRHAWMDVQGMWQVEEVGVGDQCRVAFGGGALRVAWVDSAANVLRVGVRGAAGGWTEEVLPEEPSNITLMGFAVGPGGEQAVVYDAFRLKVLTGALSLGRVTELTTGGDGDEVGVQIDGAGRVHLVYAEDSDAYYGTIPVE